MTQPADRPASPWRPTQFRVSGVYKRTAKVWVTDRRTGNRVRRAQPRYDVRWRVDHRPYKYTFEQRGWADEFARRLVEDFARGWHFDGDARRFIDPDTTTSDDNGDDEPAVTFYGLIVDYTARKWRGWAPSSRRNAVRELARATLLLVQPDVPALTTDQWTQADTWLRDTAMPPAVDHTTATETDHRWHDWFMTWSLPLDVIDEDHLHHLLEEFRSRAADGTPRQLAPSSMARVRAVLRGAFTNAVARRLIDWDPWTAVEPEAGHEPHTVDPDLVMTPEQTITLAAACAAIDPRYEAFVLLQGFCGLRPGEAVELRRRRVDLDATPPTVTLARSYNPVPDRYLQPGETMQRPLKGRGRRATRTIPVPSRIAALLAEHLAQYTDSPDDALVFTNTIGGRINLSNFHRDVWKHAVAETFPTGPLRKVRRQDLRHAAITLWLNSGVPLKVAQTWSGHKTLSVLLDTYYGVMEHDEQTAYQRVNNAINN